MSTRRLRRLSAKALGLALIAPLLVLVVPTGSAAEHGRYDRGASYKHYGKHHGKHYGKHHGKHYGKHYKHGRHRGHRTRVVVHGDYCDSGYRHGGHYTSHRSYHRSASYYCKPCGHRFSSRHHFHQHLHHHHHIPLWRLPFVIVHSTLGWIFHG